MKKIIMTLTLACSLSNMRLAEASPKWVQGPFWRAPQETKIERKLKFIDQDLRDNCNAYRMLVDKFKNNEVTETLQKRIELARKQAVGTSMESKFAARFAVMDVGMNSLIETEVDFGGDVGTEQDLLPMYNQSKATTGVYLTDVKVFELVSTEGSLVSFSRKIGLPDSEASITRDRGVLVVSLNGRDAACDLLSKSLALKTQGPAFVRLPVEVSNDLMNFYNSKVTPVVQDILERQNESTTIKAARLGYRLGSVLEQRVERYSDEQVEKHLNNLMNLLFIPKSLTPSSLLIDSSNKKIINFTSALDAAPVSITMDL
jgi:hypothetical protein